jgi:hypothetical protein
MGDLVVAKCEVQVADAVEAVAGYAHGQEMAAIRRAHLKWGELGLHAGVVDAIPAGDTASPVETTSRVDQ